MGFGTSMMSRPRHEFEVGIDRGGDGWSRQHLGCVCALMGFGTVGRPSMSAFISWIQKSRFVDLGLIFADIPQIRHRNGTKHRILNRFPRWRDLTPMMNPDGPMMGMNVSVPRTFRESGDPSVPCMRAQGFWGCRRGRDLNPRHDG